VGDNIKMDLREMVWTGLIGLKIGIGAGLVSKVMNLRGRKILGYC
jgi:hypothetical protein